MKAWLKVLLFASVPAALITIAACDETVKATAAPPAATDGGSDSGSSTGDSGTTTPSSLYDRLGGEAGITKFVDAVLAEGGADPEIASYMAPNMLVPTPAGKPSMAQIRECLIKQFVDATGGPGDYPTTVTGGWVCRDMTTAHASLHIGNGTFDKFVAIIVGVATKFGVAPDDLKLVAGYLASQKADIVDENAPDGSIFVWDGGVTPTDGGSDAPVDAPVDAPADAPDDSSDAATD